MKNNIITEDNVTLGYFYYLCNISPCKCGIHVDYKNHGLFIYTNWYIRIKNFLKKIKNKNFFWRGSELL